MGMNMEREAKERACRLWKGFLLSKEVSPEIALIFCKGALLALNEHKGEGETAVAMA
jgi:hypothetical protein